MRAAPAALALILTVLPPALGQAPRMLRLTFLGDIMAHDVNYRVEDFAEIYRGVADILLEDDLTFANLELPVDPTRPETGYPFFNGSLAYVRAALDSGVDVLSLANNHAFDGREEGIFQTLRSVAALRGTSQPFWVSGIRGNPGRAFVPATIVVKGVRVGFLALSQFVNVPDAGRYVNVVDDGNPAAVDELLRVVRKASSLVDLFIVSYHGDEEYAREPSPLKTRFFRSLIDAGAGIVFSHHPHVVQGYAITRAGGTDRLVMYSMGNFISGMTWALDPRAPDDGTAATGEAYLLTAVVGCGSNGCSVQDATPVPVANYRNARGEMVVGRMASLADGTIELGPGWRAFYARRLALMKGFLARSATGAAAR